MSTFTSDLQYEELEEGMVKIKNTVRFYINDTMTGEYIEIYPGIVSNFASIPKLFQLIFPHDHEDYKMAAAFHDPLVNEFNQQIYIKIDGIEIHKTTWQESAYWFREMMFVRQRNRRNQLNFWLRLYKSVADLVTRWGFWAVISVYGWVK